jgi:hypothetical protein
MAISAHGQTTISNWVVTTTAADTDANGGAYVAPGVGGLNGTTHLIRFGQTPGVERHLGGFTPAYQAPTAVAYPPLSVKFRRNNNPNAQGYRQLLWYETTNSAASGTNIYVVSARGTTMEDVFASDTINRGSDNMFNNTGDGSGNNNNIERVDYVVATNAAFVPVTDAQLTGAGFVVLDRGGNDSFGMAAVLNIDVSGRPTQYGPILYVDGSAGWGGQAVWTNCTLVARKDFTNEPTFPPYTNLELNASTFTTPQQVHGLFFSLSALQVPRNQIVYGYSLFAGDTALLSPTSAQLLAWTNQTYFPTNTTGADGGLDLVAGGFAIFNRDGPYSNSVAITIGHVVGRVYWDTNASGQFNSGVDPGFSNVTVKITDSLGGIAYVTTDGSGYFTHTAPSGEVIIEVVTSTLSSAGSGNSWLLTTNTYGNGANPASVTVLPGGTTTNDTGYVKFQTSQLGTLTGTVYRDLNGNATYNTTDLELMGIQVRVTDSRGGIHDLITDTNGSYSVQVPAGSTTVDVVDSTLPLGVSWALVSNSNNQGTDPRTVTVTAGGTATVYTGYTTTGGVANIVGCVYWDTSANGRLGAGEPRFTNTQVVITDAQGNVYYEATDTNGVFGRTVVTGVVSVAVIEATLPALSTGTNWTLTANNRGQGTNPNSTNVVNNATASIFFGYVRILTSQMGIVEGVIYRDVNSNGTFNAGTDVPLSGVQVKVTSASGSIYYVDTDANGFYSKQVISGTTIVDVQNATLPSSTTWLLTTNAFNEGTDPKTVTVSVGGRTVDNVGYVSANTTLGSVSGQVYQDYNFNGTYEASVDQPLVNVLMEITDTNGVMQTVLTDGNGFFSQPVVAGITTVRVATNTVATNLSLTFDTYGEGVNPAYVTVPSSGSASHNFGFADSAATLAFLASIEAWAASGGVTVGWKTAAEVGSVSFDLFRLDQGNWRRVNADLIPAANALLGAAYQIFDPGAPQSGTLVYRLVEWNERGKAHSLGPYTLTVRSDIPPPAPRLAASVASAALAAETNPVSTELRRTVGAAGMVTWADLGGGLRVKLNTRSAGRQRLDAESLAALLVQPVAEVRGWILQGQLSLSSGGQAVQWVAAPDGAALWFQAEQFKDNFTEENVYWLTAQTNGWVLQADGRAPAPAGEMTGRATVELEQDILAVTTQANDPEEDYWMWQRLRASSKFLNTAVFTVTLDGAGAALPGGLTVQLWGGSQGQHGVTAELNGTDLGQREWEGLARATMEWPVPAGLLRSGANTLRLKAINLPGASGSQWYVNRLALSYARRFEAVGGRLEFYAESNATVTVTGFAQPEVVVWEITDPRHPVIVTNLAVSANAGLYAVSFVPSNPAGRYAAFLPDSIGAVSAAGLSASAGLASPTNQAALIILAPAAWAVAAGELAQYRQAQGLACRVVTVEQVYDEFNDGRPSPRALQAFLTAAFGQWGHRPTYVLLAGNGTYDYRNLLHKNDNWVPPAMVPTAFGLFCSDSVYGDINGDGIPEMAVGRLPASTVAELQSAIAKIIAYEVQPVPAQPRALLIADGDDAASYFPQSLAAVEAALPEAFSRQWLIPSAETGLPEARAAIQNEFNVGVDLVSYLGHGAVYRLGSSGYLTAGDVPDLMDNARQPVVVASTCLAGQYAVPAFNSLAEELVLRPAAGAIAVIAPSGLAYGGDGSQLNRRLVQALQANNRLRLGDLVRGAMITYVRLGQRVTPAAIFNLIGDPSLLYNLPKGAPAPSLPPTVVLVGPANPTLSAPVEFALATTVFDLDGSIQKVELYDGSTRIGEAATGSFGIRLTGVAPGRHDYVAVATDDAGLVTTSAVWRVEVTVENLPPQVALGLQGDSTLDAPARILLQAEAVDPDGRIAKVEFFQGQTSLGSVTGPPYTLAVSGLPVGLHAFSAVATDAGQATSLPAALVVPVQPFRIVSVALAEGGGITFQWAGGVPPFVVEKISGWSPDAVWETVVTLDDGQNVTLPAEVFGAGLYRVRSQ